MVTHQNSTGVWDHGESRGVLGLVPGGVWRPEKLPNLVEHSSRIAKNDKE